MARQSARRLEAGTVSMGDARTSGADRARQCDRSSKDPAENRKFIKAQGDRPDRRHGGSCDGVSSSMRTSVIRVILGSWGAAESF